MAGTGYKKDAEAADWTERLFCLMCIMGIGAALFYEGTEQPVMERNVEIVTRQS